MSHFYATVRGSRDSEATKTGTKDSGIDAHARGWDLGGRVRLRHLAGADILDIDITGGSNDGQSRLAIDVRTNEKGDLLVTVRPPYSGTPRGQKIRVKVEKQATS